MTHDHAMIDRATILSLIDECADGLAPMLRDPTVASDYADKLLARATIFSEAAREGVTGMIAFYTGTHEDRKAFITMVAVRHSARGGKVGQRLVSRAVDHAREAGCSSMELAVQADNPPARRLYENAGFVVTGSKGDQLVMNLAL